MDTPSALKIEKLTTPGSLTDRVSDALKSTLDREDFPPDRACHRKPRWPTVLASAGRSSVKWFPA